MRARSPRRLRRLLSIVAVAATAALALGGCATTAPGADAAAKRSSTVAVDTMYGKVTVPTGAKRIIATSFVISTALVDLGVTPVGRDSYYPVLPAYDRALKSVPVVTDSDGAPDLEKVAAQKPDVIIGDVFADQVEKYRPLYKKLSAIAPTVFFEWTQAAGNWPTETAGTAKVIGRTADMDALKAAYEKKAAGIRSTYADELGERTIDLVSGNDTEWFLYSKHSSHGTVIADAGGRSGAAATQKDGFVQYSTEQYGRLKDSDILIVAASDDAELAAVTGNPVFGGLPAAKAGHVYGTSHFFPSSYRIADALLDDFADALKSAE